MCKKKKPTILSGASLTGLTNLDNSFSCANYKRAQKSTKRVNITVSPPSSLRPIDFIRNRCIVNSSFYYFTVGFFFFLHYYYFLFFIRKKRIFSPYTRGVGRFFSGDRIYGDKHNGRKKKSFYIPYSGVIRVYNKTFTVF